MQEKRKYWQPLAICHRFFTFVMNSHIARRLAKHVSITGHLPALPSSNGVVPMEDQQPFVPNRPNGVKRIYLQHAQLTPDEGSGFEMQVHYKQTDDGDVSKKKKSTDNRKLCPSKSLQEVKPIFTIMSSKAQDMIKSLSIADTVGLEKEMDNKKKGKMVTINENFTLEMVGEEDERSKDSKLLLRRATPLVYVAPNINEKSDEFIRSRKEAMRRSQSLA